MSRWRGAIVVVLAQLLPACGRGADAVLSIEVLAPASGRAPSTRAIAVEVDMRSRSRHVFSPGSADAALLFPKRVDITFRQDQTGTGVATILVCDDATQKLLRASQPIEVKPGQVTFATFELTTDASGSCADALPPDGGAGGGAAGSGGRGTAGRDAGTGGGAGRAGAGGGGAGRDGGAAGGAATDGPAGDGSSGGVCDPILPAATGPACPMGQGCYLGSGDTAVCRPAGTGMRDAPCDGPDNCAPGFVCYRSSSDSAYTCGMLCHIEFSSTDPTGLTSNCPPNPLLPFPVALLCKNFQDSLWGVCL